MYRHAIHLYIEQSCWTLLSLFIFVFVETGSRYVTQADVELLGSGNPPASASQSVKIIGRREPPHPDTFIFNNIISSVNNETFLFF